MDGVRAIEAPAVEADEDETAYRVAAAPPPPPPAIGNDERRMHVRAYNFWVSLLAGRAYPAIADFDPSRALDFGPHSVLLDFANDPANPTIAYIGDALRAESDAPHALRTVADVPARSLLSRLTDHYLQILANRAPIGFEAEFDGRRARPMLYRGILMPFSSDGERIDSVYGVVNWKELASPAEAAAIERAVAAEAAPIARGHDDPEGEGAAPTLDADAGLHDRLAHARDGAERAASARIGSRAALYRALGLAYDFALAADGCPEDYAALLEDAGIRVQKRAPMSAVVKLVFGVLDKARVTEFAAALDHGRRLGLVAGTLTGHIEAQRGGLKALVAAERVARRPTTAPKPRGERARAALRRATAQAHLDLPSDPAEFVLLLARRDADGRLAVLAPVPDESTLVDRAIRKVTR